MWDVCNVKCYAVWSNLLSCVFVHTHPVTGDLWIRLLFGLAMPDSKLSHPKGVMAIFLIPAWLRCLNVQDTCISTATQRPLSFWERTFLCDITSVNSTSHSSRVGLKKFGHFSSVYSKKHGSPLKWVHKEDAIVCMPTKALNNTTMLLAGAI